MKILVIEDEPDMRDNIISSLKKEKYNVESAIDYTEARNKLETYDYDCILLDIGLPGGSGLELLKELKEDGKETGVIVVSARGSIEDKVNGLNLGADDYLPKPFHIAELHARVKSLIRRKTLGGSLTIEIENRKSVTELRKVSVDGISISLNRKEYEVLLYLATNKDRLVNKSALAEHVWGDYIDETNSFDFIYSQIKNLRKKLKDHNAKPEITAVYGLGYKLITS